MKARVLIASLWIPLVGIAPAIEVAKHATMRDAATHEDLSKRSQEVTAPVETRMAAPPIDESKVWKPESILARSDFLCMGNLTTLVPKGAILHVPPAYAERLRQSQEASIVRWSDFYAANRSWIQTYEVTRAQAGGDAPIPEAALESIKTSPFVIVATMQGGPISVLPPKNKTNDPGKS
jgi:hypothetical protein